VFAGVRYFGGRGSGRRGRSKSLSGSRRGSTSWPAGE